MWEFFTAVRVPVIYRRTKTNFPFPLLSLRQFCGPGVYIPPGMFWEFCIVVCRAESDIPFMCSLTILAMVYICLTNFNVYTRWYDMAILETISVSRCGDRTIGSLNYNSFSVNLARCIGEVLNEKMVYSMSQWMNLKNVFLMKSLVVDESHVRNHSHAVIRHIAYRYA